MQLQSKNIINSEVGCLITPCYFRNDSPIIIYNLVLYWAGTSSLDGVDSIQSIINLYWISTPFYIPGKWKISTYNKKKYIIQVLNQKHGNYDPT